VTGFFFPVDRLWPSHGVGIISLVALTVTSLALDGVPLAGSWRWSHVVCAVLTGWPRRSPGHHLSSRRSSSWRSSSCLASAP